MSVINLNQILPLLEELDEMPNALYPSQRKTLSHITEISALGSAELTELPASFRLLTKLQKLDLSYTKVSDLSPLRNLVNLQELRLANSAVTDLTPLQGLPELKILDLSWTAVTDLFPLAQLESLESLTLSGTPIKYISALSNLKELQVLHLNETFVTDMAPIHQLTKLRELHLENTPVKDSYFLHELSALQVLDLRNTKISYLYPLYDYPQLRELYLGGSGIYTLHSLSAMPNLRFLHIRKTAVSDLTPLSELKELAFLDISCTEVSSLKPLQSLKNLQKLHMAGSKVADIEPLKELSQLEELDLDALPLTHLPEWVGTLPQLKKLRLTNLNLETLPQSLLDLDLPFYFDAEFSEEDGICLEGTSLEYPSVSLFELPKELIREYYRTLAAQETESSEVTPAPPPAPPIREVKVIFLGDGSAGKTHTIQRILAHGVKKQYDTSTTLGISIQKYEAKGKNEDFDINFWDFGGQENMHAMHRCFLTENCCYVVVVSNRWDLDRQARYWLNNIHSFAPKAPVIIAVNRWDDIPICPIDATRLYESYKNLKDIVFYSAQNSPKDVFDQLTEKIILETESLCQHAKSMPASWAKVRQQLLAISQEENRNYIDREEYCRICQEAGITDPVIRAQLLEWFNILGICFSYHMDETKEKELESYQVLNPRWITGGIYTLINGGKLFAVNGILNRQGMLTLLREPHRFIAGNTAEADYLLEGVSYDLQQSRYILEVMRKFKLSYKLSDTEEFIPALCDSDTPKELHPEHYRKHLTYELRYSYLPDSVIQRLMVQCHLTHLPMDQHWRKGLRCVNSPQQLTAVVDTGEKDNLLRIDVYSGGEAEPWSLLEILRTHIFSIHRELGIKAREYVLVQGTTESIPVPMGMLLAALDQNRPSLPLYSRTDGLRDYSMEELLSATFGAERIAQTARQAQEEKRSPSQIIFTNPSEPLPVLP